MIIYLCGYLHSGTSYVADLLIEHGADPGECYQPPDADYTTHENAVFRTYCAREGQIDTDGLLEGDHRAAMIQHLESLDLDRPHLLKYPKASACIGRFCKLPGFRAVFVTRPWNEWRESYVRRTGLEEEAAAMNHRMSESFYLSNAPCPVLVVNFASLREGRGVGALLRYVGLK